MSDLTDIKIDFQKIKVCLKKSIAEVVGYVQGKML